MHIIFLDALRSDKNNPCFIHVPLRLIQQQDSVFSLLDNRREICVVCNGRGFQASARELVARGVTWFPPVCSWS